MGRCYIQIVMGPAGSGKSTYCHAIQEHCASLGKLRRRKVHVANLDPAAENFGYDLAFDIRDLICVDDVMEELGLGPNGGLLYCMEYLLENMDWLQDELDAFDDDEYLLLDCPGQIELYTHVPIMRRVVDQLRMWGYGSTAVSVFVVDATFLCDAPKFISGSLLSLSAMLSLEMPHINIMSKCDLVDTEQVDRVLETESATQLYELEEYNHMKKQELEDYKFATFLQQNGKPTRKEDKEWIQRVNERRQKQNKLTKTICQVLDDFSMVSFLPLNIKDEESLDHVLLNVDQSIQFGEDIEVRGADMDDTELFGNMDTENDE